MTFTANGKRQIKLTISQIWKWEGKNCPKSFLLMNLSGIKLLILESFRSEDENECLSIIHGASTRFNLKFLRVFLKKKNTPESFNLLFSPKKLVRLFILKEVKPSPDRKMIKLLTSVNLFPPLRHSRWSFSLKLVVEWRRLGVFPPKWRWFTREHYLVLRKSCTRSRPRQRI